MARHPLVVGLLELENRDSSILLKGIAMAATLSAPRLGLTLVKNYLSSSKKQRQAAFTKENKFYARLPSINSAEAVDLVTNNKIDLIVNARTRSIFKPEILKAPRLGCINIHHGLLPGQRGLMCDFWAHLENEPSGFSIHQMTSKIDDGPLLKVQEIKSEKKSYVHSLLLASEMEAKVCGKLLFEIQGSEQFKPLNANANNIKYRKNPSLIDGYRMQLKGIRV